jgi:hypothetical protein
MAITNLQQARQMFRYGGDTMGGPNDKSSNQGPAGGASAGGNYGGDSSGGVGANQMSGAGGGKDTGPDPGFQNALNAAAKRQATITASQDPNFGQFFGSRVPTYETPTFGQRIGQGIGNFASGVVDFYKQGGVLGAVTRGLGSLFGPSVPSTGNVGPAGIKTDGTYGTVGDAIRASQRNESPVDMGRDNNTYIPPLYAEDETIEDIDGDGIISLQDIVLRFQGADRTLNPQAVGLQDTDQLRAMIQERVKNLYT